MRDQEGVSDGKGDEGESDQQNINEQPAQSTP